METSTSRNPKGLHGLYRDNVTNLRLEGWGSIPGRGKIFLFSIVSRPALGHTEPPIQWVPEEKRPGREADHSPPSSAEVKSGGAITPLPHICFHGVMLNWISTGKTLHVEHYYFLTSVIGTCVLGLNAFPGVRLGLNSGADFCVVLSSKYQIEDYNTFFYRVYISNIVEP
jgi:hypothetical protein